MPRGLEGSRFPRWQLCGFAAGGSRRLPSVFASIQRLARIVPIKSANISNHGGSWVAFGSRLPPSHRAAVLRSGSPPDAGPATPRCSLGRTKRFAALLAPAEIQQLKDLAAETQKIGVAPIARTFHIQGDNTVDPPRTR